MPRLRILLLGFVTVLLTGGLGAGLAWRWIVLDVALHRQGRRLGREELWAAVDRRALVIGLWALPITFGGILTFLAPLMLEWTPYWTYGGVPAPWPALVASTLAAAGLLGWLAILYWRGLPGALRPRSRRAWMVPWAAHAATSLACGLPGLAYWGIVILERRPLYDRDSLLWLLPLLTILSFLAPAVGAIAAVGPLVRRWDVAVTQRAAGASTGTLLAIASAVPLGLLWCAVAFPLVWIDPGRPVLDQDAFDAERCGALPYPYIYEGTTDLLQAALVDVHGEAMGNANFGAVRVAWIRQEDGTFDLVAGPIGSLDRSAVHARRMPLTADILPLPDGLVVTERRSERSVWLELLAPDLSVRARRAVQFPRPLQSVVLAARPRGGGVWLAASDGERVHVREVDRRLQPTGRRARVSARNVRIVGATTGEFVCLQTGGPVLPLRADMTVFTPSLRERVGRSPGRTSLVVLFLLIGLALGTAVWRSGRLTRLLARARPRQDLWVGRLGGDALRLFRHSTSQMTKMTKSVPDQSAWIHTREGEVLRLPTDARWEGATDAFAADGPCTVVGSRALSGVSPYRADVPALAAGAVVLAGPLDEVRVLARARFSTAARRAVAVAWLLGGLPMLLVLLADLGVY